VPGAACLEYPDALAVTVALPVSVPVAVAIPLTVALDELEQCVPEPLRREYAADRAYAAGQQQRRIQPDELAAIGIRVAVRDGHGHGHHRHKHRHRHEHRHRHGHHHSHGHRQRYHKPDQGGVRGSRRRQPELGPEPVHQRQRQ
jgi:hypothetical protein